MFVIRFDYPEGLCFAAHYKDSLGWTVNPANAIRFKSEDSAKLTLENGYGPHTARYATVVKAVAA